MKITKHLHSFVELEEAGKKVLIDPGSFSFMEGKVKPEQFIGISAIFITHAHGDHYDVEALKVILQNNPGCVVYTNSDVKKVLAEGGLASKLFEAGDAEIASFQVKAFFAAHEPILNRVMVKNTAFMFNSRFLHPGDSYAPEVFQYQPEVLALAVAGPWMDINQGWEFTEKCHAKTVLPVHDGHIKDFFSSAMYKLWGAYFESQGVRFVPALAAGDSIEI